MKFYQSTRQGAKAGFSLIEMLVTAAIVAIVFGGLFVSIQLMIKLIHASKAEAGATALAVDRMEFLRSLPYEALGTPGGPPYGAVPDTSTISLNDIEYQERVTIQYIDDPADGLGTLVSGGNDANDVIEDYKKVIVEIAWDDRGQEKKISLSANIVPEGVETGAGGGSLRIVVQNKNLEPVPNATVVITNSSLATTTNTTRYTNLNGELLLSGLPAGAGYMVSVTKPGYSSDYTIEPTAANPNPFNRPLTIAESMVTTKYFMIDQVSDLTVAFHTPIEAEMFEDSFNDSTYIDTFQNTNITGSAEGDIALTQVAGIYPSTGAVYSVPIGGDTYAWTSLTLTTFEAGDSSVLVHVYYDDGGTYRLIPDAMLPGNSAGFIGSHSTIDLSGIDPEVYDEIILGGQFTSEDGSDTSFIKYWIVDYVSGGQPITDVDVEIRGSKLLGDDPNPVYKYEATLDADGYGEINLEDIEWDVYNIFPNGYRLAGVCPDPTLSLDPNTLLEASATLVADGVGLRVSVVDTTYNPIAGASVLLSAWDDSYAAEQDTDECGQTYFFGNGMTPGIDYTAWVCASGYSCGAEYVVIDDTSAITARLNEQ